jgi:hypothetical protein
MQQIIFPSFVMKLQMLIFKANCSNPILLREEDWAWLNLSMISPIFYVFGFVDVISQVNNEKKCYINHGFSLHYESYDLALVISSLFINYCTRHQYIWNWQKLPWSKLFILLRMKGVSTIWFHQIQTPQLIESTFRPLWFVYICSTISHTIIFYIHKQL